MPLVSGWLHQPTGAPLSAVALFHGAGANCESKLMVALAEAFCEAGSLVLRGDLPFRQQRPTGPPMRNHERDREGILAAVQALRALAPGIPVCLAGHSYGGRMSSMLCSEQPSVADMLLLLAYPLHPPKKSGDLRTAHFGQLRTPVVFVHGTRDPFGSVDELAQAIAAIPAFKKLVAIEKAGHSLPPSVAIELPALLTWK